MNKEFFRRSIANRLAVMYAVMAAIVLSLIFMAFEWVERTEIDMYQTAEMKSRFDIIEHLADEKSNFKQWAIFKKQLEAIAPRDNGTYIRVDSKNPDYVIEAPFEIVLRKIKKHHGFGKIEINGSRYRTLSRLVPARGERPDVVLSLAFNTYIPVEDDALINLMTAVILVISICAIGWLGWLIARHSLRPVDLLSRAAAQIGPHKLSQRLPSKNLPEELKGLVLSFNGVLDKLEESASKQEAFNSDVAHELRTPVGNMIGTTEVALSRERSKEELEEVLHSNLEELERLSSIIRDMLFLSRADQGEAMTNRTEISLAEEARKTAEFLEVLFEEKGTKLEIEGDAKVIADRSLLGRVITNLLGNALQHGETGRTIKVEISRSREQVVFDVINRGATIEEAELKNIFNRFYRLSKERRNSGDHHGLGLAIVKAIIDMHDGEVTASSKDGIIRIGFRLAAAD